ncbi:hypothetical protein FRX31_027115 [Thalictrum thalictroides]|uniref:Uncharacterized protein n=1 Tax=Thalictrum thalictroides TaxID=46969 RepID=A0A7J6VFB6_THATH|nr:hypothetical protein FRX31_027115 [Thalictrum thalictroides]
MTLSRFHRSVSFNHLRLLPLPGKFGAEMRPPLALRVGRGHRPGGAKTPSGRSSSAQLCTQSEHRQLRSQSRNSFARSGSTRSSASLSQGRTRV